jgi:hypothetical protein
MIYAAVALFVLWVIRRLAFPDLGRAPHAQAVFAGAELDDGLRSKIRSEYDLRTDEPVVALVVQRVRGRPDRHVVLTPLRLSVDDDGGRTTVRLHDIRGWTEPPAGGEMTEYRFEHGPGPRFLGIGFEVAGAANREKLDALLWPTLEARRDADPGSIPGIR